MHVFACLSPWFSQVGRGNCGTSHSLQSAAVYSYSRSSHQVSEASPDMGDSEVRIPPDHAKCCSCRLVKNLDVMTRKQRADPAKGTVDQYQCRLCASLAQRILREEHASPCPLGFTRGVSPSSRARFMARHGEAFGKELRSAMTETLSVSQSRTMTTRFSQEGEYMNVSGHVEGELSVEEKYEQDPEALAHILANGRRIVCPVSGKEKVWVPTYRAGFVDQECSEEDLRRRCDSDTVIRPKSKKRKVVAVQNEGENQPGGEDQISLGAEPRQAVDVIIPAGQQRRLLQVLPQLRDLAAKLSEAHSSASAPDMSGQFGAQQLGRATDIHDELLELEDECAVYNTKKVAPKGTMPAFFKKCATAMAEAKKFIARITAILHETVPDS